MSRLRKAAHATVVAQAFNWTGLLLSLVTIPLYLQWLGQERYGVLLTGLAFASYLMFSDAGLTWGSMLLIAQANGRDDRNAIQAIVRVSFSFVACSALLVIAIVLTGNWLLTSTDFLASWLPRHPEFPGLMLAIGASVVCNLAFSPFYNVFVGLQETHVAATFQGSGRVLGTIAAVAVASTGAPLGLVFGANVAAAFLVGTLASIHCRRRHAWAFQSGPMWEPVQVRRQLRTGAKSFGMQVGMVLWGTAPVVAISSGAGPQFVPLFSIPMSLLNAPLSVLSSLSASLQPGYAEAISRRERQWIADTVRRILQQVLVVLGLLGCGFLLLAAPFVSLWTGDRINLEQEMLCSILAIASAGAVVTVFRFALTGINQHRRAAASDLICGLIAITLAPLCVRHFGYASVGPAIVIAVCLTSGWILPREVRRVVSGQRLWPRVGFWVRWLVVVSSSALVGQVVIRLSRATYDWLDVITAGVAISTVYLLGAWLLSLAETNHLRHLFARIALRSK